VNGGEGLWGDKGVEIGGEYVDKKVAGPVGVVGDD